MWCCGVGNAKRQIGKINRILTNVFEYIAAALILRTGRGRKGSISLSKLTRKAVKPLMM